RFDAVDDELSRRFQAGASADADPDTVLDGMRPRLQRARTRRRASIASGVAGVGVVVVALVLALGSAGGDGGSVRTPPASPGPQRSVPSLPTAVPSGGSVTPDSVPDTVDDRGGADDHPSATTPVSVPTSVPATAPAATPTDYFADFSSEGGKITVHV